MKTLSYTQLRGVRNHVLELLLNIDPGLESMSSIFWDRDIENLGNSTDRLYSCHYLGFSGHVVMCVVCNKLDQ